MILSAINAKCSCTGYHNGNVVVLFAKMLSGIILCASMLNDIVLSVILLRPVMLTVVILNVIAQSVIMSVTECHFAEGC
jgi:hypothetical protein